MKLIKQATTPQSDRSSSDRKAPDPKLLAPEPLRGLGLCFILTICLGVLALVLATVVIVSLFKQSL